MRDRRAGGGRHLGAWGRGALRGVWDRGGFTAESARLRRLDVMLKRLRAFGGFRNDNSIMNQQRSSRTNIAGSEPDREWKEGIMRQWGCHGGRAVVESHHRTGHPTDKRIGMKLSKGGPDRDTSTSTVSTVSNQLSQKVPIIPT